jgi:cell division protein ZapA|tara:strand:- start:5254 stop:5565 length:312 start_codon:yes stop_codon:yes gene_type:complete
VSQANTVTVQILEKEYQVACPEEQESQLVTSAKYLDKQMRSIRNSGKVIGLERIAVMAALNIGYELLQASDHPEANPPSGDSVKRLNRKLDDALYDLRQLEIG